MDIKYIDTNDKLNDCIDFLNNVSVLAIDLEFDKNRFQYGFTMCLMQIYANNCCFIIDSLSKEMDIKLLFPTLENPKIEKVAFAFNEDLRLLHSLKCFPKNIFDLQLAIQIIDYPPKSLSWVLEEITQIPPSKSSQKSNWLKRPLNENQLDYASKDVIYLIDLQKVIIKKAKQKDVLNWIKQENETFDKVDYSEIDNNAYLKDVDIKHLTEIEWLLFKNLMKFREDTAKKMSKPNYQIVHRDIIREIAIQPTLVNNWIRQKGIHPRIKTVNFANELRNIIAKTTKEAGQLKLSKTKAAKKPMSKAEIEARRELGNKTEQLKTNYYLPIKQLIEKNYGENTANFLVSNRIITELCSEQQQLKPYKKKLFDKYANQLKISI